MTPHKFWNMLDDYLAAGGEDDHESARAFFKAQRNRRIRPFWMNLRDRIAELWRHDVHAVGAILGGKIGPDVLPDFALWVIRHGREFFEEVNRNPAHAATKVDGDSSGSRFGSNLHVASGVYEDRFRWSRFRELPPLREIRKTPPAGDRWTWRQLRTMHPDLWQVFFVERDRRPLPPDDPLEAMPDVELCLHATEPLRSWIDFYTDPDYLVEQYATLPAEQRCLHGVQCCDMEVDNGGFDQFFSNSTGAVAREALEGMAMFGADPWRVWLAGYAAMFPDGMPSRDRATRRRQLDAILEAAGVRVIDDIEIAGAESSIDRDMDSFVAGYVRARPGAFFRSSE